MCHTCQLKDLEENCGVSFDENGKIILDVYNIEKLNWWTMTTDGAEASCRILNFDNIDKEWNKFKKSIGPKGFMRDGLHNKNPTNSLSKIRVNTDYPNYFDYYDEEDLETIHEIYGEEIELYKDIQ